VYLDGERAAQLVGNVALFIADLDPAHADEYTANSAAYQEEISVLDAVLVQECPDTTFAVTNPDDWAYAAERYDLTLTTDPSAEAWDVLLREAENYMKLMEEVREGCE
jgi:ABC-type Zn uptake system ZnuABC Zn-binding protein ZnuA